VLYVLSHVIGVEPRQALADGQGGIRQLADAQCDVDPFVDQIERTVEQQQTNRDGRMEVDEVVNDRP
jgi:hypothetical protein